MTSDDNIIFKYLEETPSSSDLHLVLKQFKEENFFLKQKIEELETRLKKYTNGDNHKRYYEKNKEKIKELGSSYLQKLKLENPEKIKEYSRKAYAKKKLNKSLAEVNTIITDASFVDRLINQTINDTIEVIQPN
jgi:hypothetical protein